MRENLQILAIPFLLLLAGVAYVVPLAFMAAGLVRVLFRWHCGWKWLGGALLAMAPQALILLLAPDMPDATPYVTVPLVLLGMGLYWRGTRGYRIPYFLLETGSFFLMLVYVLTGINWIVH